VKEAFKSMTADVKTLKRELIKTIKALPQNPRITPLGDSCFSIKASDFGTECWSASYHDFTPQYRAISQLVEQSRLEDVIPRLEAALKKGTIPGNRQSRIRLHPEVIENVRGIL